MESFVWSSRNLPLAQRASAYVAINEKCHGSWDIEITSGPDFFADVGYRRIGDVGFTQMATAPVRTVRSVERVKAADQDSFFCLLRLTSGIAVLRQGGNETVLRAGDMAMWDSARPAGMDVIDAVSQAAVLIPARIVRGALPDAERMCGTAVRGDRPFGRILASHLSQFIANWEQIDVAHQRPLLAATLDLVSASFRGSGVLVETLPSQLERAQDYILANMEDPALGVSSVASALACSPRSLHRAFQSTGLSISRWIRLRRLMASRRDLARRVETITAIAMRYGFYDAAHFSRAFKEEFNQSPQDYRKSVIN